MVFASGAVFCKPPAIFWPHVLKFRKFSTNFGLFWGIILLAKNMHWNIKRWYWQTLQSFWKRRNSRIQVALTHTARPVLRNSKLSATLWAEAESGRKSNRNSSTAKYAIEKCFMVPFIYSLRVTLTTFLLGLHEMQPCKFDHHPFIFLGINFDQIRHPEMSFFTLLCDVVPCC